MRVQVRVRGQAARLVIPGLLLFAAFLLVGGDTAGPCNADEAKLDGKSAKFRVIISTDFPPLDVIPVKGVKNGDPPEKCSDPDDVQSMVRYLLYTNEFDTEGLLVTSGTFANVAKKKNLLDMLDLYGKVEQNLRKHDRRYPTAKQLRAVTWEGRSGTWGAPAVGTKKKKLDDILGKDKDSEASNAIIKIVDQPDPRPVWICVWGGSREVAQAIWKVKATRTRAELDRFLSKMRLYLIAKQDATADWLLDESPSLFIILSENNYMGMFWSMPGADQKIADLAWANKHVREGHGPLGATYPRSGWDPKVPGVWEGDTPSFLHLVSAIRKVNDPEKPDQPGWGGRFVRPDTAKNHWFDHKDGTKAIWRWRADVQKEFAERANWMLP